MNQEYKPFKPVSSKPKKPQRKYAPLWCQIKESYPVPNEVEIYCPSQLKARIKKQLANEKSIDDDWPLRRYTKLKSKDTEEGIIFWLAPYRVGEVFSKVLKEY